MAVIYKSQNYSINFKVGTQPKIVCRMKEVDTFLKTEHTASSDPVTLDAQLKESASLQDDLVTLQPTVDAINELGIR